jgi:hypothetical protein
MLCIHYVSLRTKSGGYLPAQGRNCSGRVRRSGFWVIDFEVAHYGDPAFDVAFMLSHLLLKRLHIPETSSELELCAETFWGAYEGVATRLCPSAAYVLGHVGCLMVARVDGKSPVEYLTDAEREAARRIGSELLLDPPGNIDEALALSDPCRVAGRHRRSAEGRQ